MQTSIRLFGKTESVSLCHKTKHLSMVIPSIFHIKALLHVSGRGRLSSPVQKKKKKNDAKQRKELQSICFSKGTQPCVQEASMFALWD